MFLADRRAQFEKLEYTEDDYQKELEHIEKVCLSQQILLNYSEEVVNKNMNMRLHVKIDLV